MCDLGKVTPLLGLISSVWSRELDLLMTRICQWGDAMMGSVRGSSNPRAGAPLVRYTYDEIHHMMFTRICIV